MIKIDQVQSHANDRCVALSIKATKLTARLLAQAMQAVLKQQARSPTVKHKRGKQSIQSLVKQGASIENTPIVAENIGSFKKVARKYNIDFALKKDISTDPPGWLVFFKAKDNKAIECAFKEFTKDNYKAKPKSSAMEAELERFTNDIDSKLVPAKARDNGEIEL